MQLKEILDKIRLNGFERNMKLLKTLIGDDEKIIHAVWGATSSSGGVTCVLALTDKRLIRSGKKIFGNELVTLPLKSLTFVDEVSGFREKGAHFYFVNGRVSFYPALTKDNLKELDALMKKVKAVVGDEVVPAQTEDIPATIRKLAKLHKDKIIAKKEFEDKKKELLERI